MFPAPEELSKAYETSGEKNNDHHQDHGEDSDGQGADHGGRCREGEKLRQEIDEDGSQEESGDGVFSAHDHRHEDEEGLQEIEGVCAEKMDIVGIETARDPGKKGAQKKS
jgi:hypothetical protein